MIAVLDAGAAIAYLHGEVGAEVVETAVLDPSVTCAIHALNLYEVYYDFLRRSDTPTADGFVRDLLRNGVMSRADMDESLWQDAARLKVQYRLSVADTFALALTRRLGGELLTTDHHELDSVAKAGECTIRFIR